MITPDTDTLKAAIKWLVSDNPRDRESGRTYMLAEALFEKAKKCPGEYVHVFDHDTHNGKTVVDYMREIAKQDGIGIETKSDLSLQRCYRFKVIPTTKSKKYKQIERAITEDKESSGHTSAETTNRMLRYIRELEKLIDDISLEE